MAGWKILHAESAIDVFSRNIVSYRNSVYNTKHRHVTTKLWLSSHHLNIETGRWRRSNPVLRVERRCPVVVEDEYCDIPWYRAFPRNPFIINVSMYFGPQRSGMFRWSWCRVLYNWRERWTRPLEHASPIAQFMQ